MQAIDDLVAGDGPLELPTHLARRPPEGDTIVLMECRKPELICPYPEVRTVIRKINVDFIPR